jgi:hypothetical protein
MACTRQAEQGTFPIMSANQQASGTLPSRNKTMRLRVVGIIVLLLGFTTAGAVYWIRTRAGSPAEDELLAENARAQSRQMGILYGRMGVLTQDLFDHLRQPGTQACLIAAASILVAVGCFYLARLSDEDAEAR